MEFLPEPAWPIRVNGLVVEEVEAPFGFVKFGANACRGERASNGWTRMDENPIAPVFKLSRHQSQLLMMSSCAITIVKEGDVGAGGAKDSPKATASGS